MMEGRHMLRAVWRGTKPKQLDGGGYQLEERGLRDFWDSGRKQRAGRQSVAWR